MGRDRGPQVRRWQHSNVLVSHPGIVRRHRVHVPPHRCAWVFLRALQHFAALQAVLGHESIDMTMRYAHLVTDHLHEAVAKAGSRLGTRPSNRERPSEPPQTSTMIMPSFTPCWTMTASNRAGTLDIGVGTVGSAEAIVVRRRSASR